MNTSTNCLNPSPIDLFSRCLLDGLKAELFLSPKPGLVDLHNSGSHPDLNIVLMARSVALMRIYLDDLCRAIRAGEPWSKMVALGRCAEDRMFAETGTNCHKGGIFLCGLLLVACSRIGSPENPAHLKRAVQEAASEFFRVKKVTPSHGNRVRAEYPLAGIVGEALQGLPALFDVFLPAMAEADIEPGYRLFLGMACMMQVVEDSTSLHRCGWAGMTTLRKAGREIETMIRDGQNPVPFLHQVDLDFRRMNLTMGGVADLLGVGLGYLNFQILADRLNDSVDSVPDPFPPVGISMSA